MTVNIRRVVTGHDRNGKAIVISDGEPKRKRAAANVDQALLWVTHRTPATNDGSDDGGDVDIGIPPPPKGSVFRVIDFLPESGADAAPAHTPDGVDTPAGARHPGMHRTNSIDYAIVMEGEIDMLLDDSEVHLKTGDVVIQRGTYHAWANRGTKPCKIFFVLIDADPVA